MNYRGFGGRRRRRVLIRGGPFHSINRDEITRLKAQHPNMSHQQVFGTTAKNVGACPNHLLTHSNTNTKGSSTAFIIALTHQGLSAINLGDSGFMVVRKWVYCIAKINPLAPLDYRLKCIRK
ncbi:hypothetical protein L1987_18801 [Smallanthus sonchifolius]|uniref:Uncharacterized protein n=1 Tax=Smallanthus sonchifolius TaxID=185202 RepID=A0ACB9J0L7_9ASTR|nr:hypothetical protein L1987_18801 [Smallanthus sonchifolius]